MTRSLQASLAEQQSRAAQLSEELAGTRQALTQLQKLTGKLEEDLAAHTSKAYTHAPSIEDPTLSRTPSLTGSLQGRATDAHTISAEDPLFSEVRLPLPGAGRAHSDQAAGAAGGEGSASMLQIVCSQRDRFKARIVQLEAVRLACVRASALHVDDVGLQRAACEVAGTGERGG